MPAWPQPLPVLVGAGPTHLRWAASLAAAGHARRQGSLGDWVVPQARAIYLPALWNWIAREQTAAPALLDLPALADAAGLRLHIGSIEQVGWADRRVKLADGEPLRGTALSLDLLPEMPRGELDQVLPGARTHALCAWPLETFAAIWVRMNGWLKERPRHLVVVGQSRHALHLALAIQAALVHHAGGRVSVVLDGPHPPAAGAPALAELRARGVTVLPDGCVGMGSGHVLLACGAQLVCDAAVLASRTQAPSWVADSGCDPALARALQAGAPLATPLLGPGPLPLAWREAWLRRIATHSTDATGRDARLWHRAFWSRAVLRSVERQTAHALMRLALAQPTPAPASPSTLGAHAAPR